jgi:uncharacterized protein YbjT (DUF2867 family)
MILVTGATGDVGLYVTAGLLRSGHQVKALTRDPARASLPAGVEVVTGDLTDPDALRRALKGADTLFLILVNGGAEAIKASLDGRPGNCPDHVVVLSGRPVTERLDNPLLAKYVAGEAAVANSGVPATVLRPNAFASLALHWAPGIRASGLVRTPFPGLALPVIDPRDVAAVAVAAITDGGHRGRTYPLSGPESLTVRGRTRIIAEVIGRELRVEQVSPGEYVQSLAHHLDAGFARAVTSLDQHFAEHPLTVVPAVEEITGHPARTFRDWVTDHADAFR